MLIFILLGCFNVAVGVVFVVVFCNWVLLHSHHMYLRPFALNLFLFGFGFRDVICRTVEVFFVAVEIKIGHFYVGDFRDWVGNDFNLIFLSSSIFSVFDALQSCHLAEIVDSRSYY